MVNIRTLAVSAALIVATLVSPLLTPRTAEVGGVGRRDLDALIPHDFGDWTYLPYVSLVVPSDTRATNIYTQVVARGYSDREGHMLMFLAAYGPVQDQLLKAHRPELCYTAAGFRILTKSSATVRYDQHASPLTVTRLTALRESRFEPVSYWIRVGDTVSRGVIDNQLIRLRYGMRGIIPDGLLVRTSTVGLAPDASFVLQERFISDLLSRMSEEERQFFTGRS